MKAIDNGRMTVKICLKSFNVSDAVMLVGEVWRAVMNSVRKRLCLYLACNFRGFSVESNLKPDKMRLPKKVALVRLG